jgi:hypothetical protein
LLCFKHITRDALEAIKALILYLGITLFLSSQATAWLSRAGRSDEQEFHVGTFEKDDLATCIYTSINFRRWPDYTKILTVHVLL